MDEQTILALEEQARRFEVNYPRLVKRMTVQVVELAEILKTDSARVRAALDELTREAAGGCMK